MPMSVGQVVSGYDAVEILMLATSVVLIAAVAFMF